MEVKRITSGEYAVNTYLVSNKKGAILIDAGASPQLIQKKYKGAISAIFLTHTHFDHIENLDNLINEYNCPVYVSKIGVAGLYNNKINLSKNLIIKDKEHIVPINFNEINILGENIKVYNTPGHSDCSVVYEINNLLFTGDTLFFNTIGRFDCFGGDAEKEKKSLFFLKSLHPFLTYYAGHGFSFDYNRAKLVLDNIDNFFN